MQRAGTAKFNATIAGSSACGWSKDGVKEAFAARADQGVILTVSKRSRKYFTSASLAGSDEVYTTEAMTSLRLPGQPALTIGGFDNADCEVVNLLDRFEIIEIKMKSTISPRRRRIRSGFAASILLATAAFVPASQAQDLDVPIVERSQEDLDTCALGQVRRLKAQGDGFLAVRTGPDSNFRKIDELHNGDLVWIFDQRSDWYGVVYGVAELSCSPIDRDRFLPDWGKSGWIHSNWVDVIAG